MTDGFDTVDVAQRIMSSTENNTQGARRDEQRRRFLSRENIIKMFKTTIVLSALFLSIWAVVLNHSVESLEPNSDEESAILVETEGREADVYCPEGGADIFLGTDFDGNGKLSTNEITTSTKVCHGQQGLSGPQGQSGSDGENGFNGNSSLVNLTALSPGIPCQFGGIQIQSGHDNNSNQYLDESEIQTTAHVCDGQLGGEGPEGQQGTDGAQGYSALIEQESAPTSICPQGIIMKFGVDDGIDMAIANDGILHDDEVRESLQICSEQLYEGLVFDSNVGVTNGFSGDCSNLQTAEIVLFSSNDGTNGCELWILDEENSPSLLVDIHSTGDSIPGRELGIHVVDTARGPRFFFDADDGINGRELWVSDGTAIGTNMLGDMESGDAIDWTSELTTWMDGVVFTTQGQQGHRMWWSNGSVTTSIWQAPWFSSSASSDLMNQSTAISSLGQDLLLGDESGLWFAAKDAQTGLEMMYLDEEGTLHIYDLQPFGDSSPSIGLPIEDGFVVAASDGTGRQLAKLDRDGGYQWLTSMTKDGTTTPTSVMAPAFGIQQLGETLVFDVVYRGADATLFGYSLSTGTLQELSTSILAPGHSVDVVNNGDTIWFDCVLGNTGMEVCQTDGTVTGTKLSVDLMPGVSTSQPRALAYIDSTLYVLAQGLDGSGTNSGHALWSIEGHSATLVLDVWKGVGNNSNAGTYGSLVATSNHLLFIADDGQHGHELHQYLRSSIRDQWMVWD
jgi:ELWxxDGT repeat protein